MSGVELTPRGNSANPTAASPVVDERGYPADAAAAAPRGEVAAADALLADLLAEQAQLADKAADLDARIKDARHRKRKGVRRVARAARRRKKAAAAAATAADLQLKRGAQAKEGSNAKQQIGQNSSEGKEAGGGSPEELQPGEGSMSAHGVGDLGKQPEGADLAN